MFKEAQQLWHREILLLIRNPSECLHPLLFFIVMVSVFPLALSPNPQLLSQVGPGFIWISVLFSAILSLPHLFYSDYHDGSLEQLLLRVRPLSCLTLIKVGVHCLFLGAPFILLSPILAVAYHLSSQAIAHLIWSLVLGVPCLCLLGSIAASISLGLRNSSLILALILLPLYVPILIFATSAVLHSGVGESAAAEYALLGALLIFLLILAPLVSAYCLRIAVEEA